MYAIRELYLLRIELDDNVVNWQKTGALTVLISTFFSSSRIDTWAHNYTGICNGGPGTELSGFSTSSILFVQNVNFWTYHDYESQVRKLHVKVCLKKKNA